MDKKIKIFQNVKKNLTSIGYSENQRGFHKEQLLRGFEGLLAVILQFVYLIHAATSTKEYMDSIYAITAGVGIFIAYLSMNINFSTIFVLIDDMEQLVNES